MSLSGLQTLQTLDQLQLVKRLTSSDRFHQLTTHKIKNNKGEMVYQASGEYDFMISDLQCNQVIHLYRETLYKGCSPCFSSDVLQVYGPSGNLVGTVEKNPSFFTLDEFDIKNSDGTIVLKIVRSTGTDCKILSFDKSNEIGTISSHLGGFFSKAVYFTISFPVNLDVQMKALLLGCCFF